MAAVQSIQRAFSVLRALSRSPMGVTQLSESVGLPKSTVARLLAALEEEGAVEQIEVGGQYSIGDGLLDLSGGLSSGRNLVSLARPFLTALALEIDETVGLSFVNELRPVTFQWKKKKELPEDFDLYEADSDERVMNGKYNHGFIAQEVKSVIDKYSGIKDGFDFWSKSSDGMERVAPSALMSIMVKAVQELSAENKALSDRITILENK